ncbi:hypothetical protein C9374_007780 [Naegleria lovaniensis]|uniref:Uncharacterized protein n=1 Tax=Naegleria lovaniensis TaxID=51637 RepID=A0AA88GKN8_NAELO|nr:uncharacterized protein C9374_007780 [Naegleria lovaniensis]KAG2379142.1 hypothetical protein C9374_007780 [Naegleria lovaniensis]
MYPKSSKPYETHTIYMNNNPISIKSVTLNSKYDPAARYERNPEEPNNFFKRVRMGRLYGDKTPWEYYLHYDENDRSRDSYQSLKAKMDEYNSRMQSKEDRKNKIVMDTDEFRKIVDNLTKKSVSSQETQTSTQQEENCMTTNPSQPTPVLVPTANSMVLEEELTSNSARSSPKGALSKKKKKKELKKNSLCRRIRNHSKHPRIIVTKPTSSKKSKLDPTSSTKSKNKAMTKPERINTTTSYYSNCSSSSASSKSTRSSMITEGPEKQKQRRKTSITSKPVLTTDKRFEKSMKRMQSTKKKAETVDKYINLLASPDKKLVKERMESCSRHSSPSSKSTNSMITSTTTSAHLCDEQDSRQLGKEYDEICSVFPSTVSTAVATSKTVQKCFDDVLKYFEKHKFDSALKENASDLEDVTLSSFSEDTDILAKYHTSDYEDNEELDEKFFEQASDFSDNESYDEFTQDTENLMLNASNLSISSNCSIDTISMSSSRDEISIAVSSHLLPHASRV